MVNVKKHVPIEVTKQLKLIGQKFEGLRKTTIAESKSFTEENGINRMTLWRIQNGKDFQLSKLLQILNAIGISPEDFFKGIK